jgi:hypothetical protein
MGVNLTWSFLGSTTDAVAPSGNQGQRFSEFPSAIDVSVIWTNPETGGNNSRYFRAWNVVGESESSKASGGRRAPIRSPGEWVNWLG